MIPYRLFSFFALLLSLAGCSRPSTIPDEELSMIFHDIFLTNAYLQRGEIERDSLMIYEPIFRRYGYTTEDVHHTLTGFSRRKSARISDVVEAAIVQLEKESDYYNKRVAVLDTIDAIARRTFAHTLFERTELRVRRVEDTARLRLRIPLEGPGEYRVEYVYRIDSLDKNDNQRAHFYLLGSSGRQQSFQSLRYRRYARDRVSRTLTADTSSRYLLLDLARYGAKMKRPHLSVDSLRVVHFLPKAQALDSLTAHVMRFEVFEEGFFTPPAPADSALWYTVPPRRAPAPVR